MADLTTNWVFGGQSTGVDFYEEGEGVNKTYYKRKYRTFTRWKYIQKTTAYILTDSNVGDTFANPTAYITDTQLTASGSFGTGSEAWVLTEET